MGQLATVGIKIASQLSYCDKRLADLSPTLPSLTSLTRSGNPGLRFPARISVLWPSESPTVTGIGAGCPSRKVQTTCLRAVDKVASGAVVLLVQGGVKRSALLGTRIASVALCVVISAVAVMPGRSSSSELSTLSKVS